MINQLRSARFKRVVQTVLYAPHFISVMVICGMIKIFLSPTGGLLNLLLGTQIDFLTQSEPSGLFTSASGIWQDAGWGCIIYLATLANVDPGLYEAAKVDGASVFQRILNIDIPELLPMAILNLIMAAGGLMNVSFEKVWLLQTDLNKATSDVIAVYVYEQGSSEREIQLLHGGGIGEPDMQLVQSGEDNAGILWRFRLIEPQECFLHILNQRFVSPNVQTKQLQKDFPKTGSLFFQR